MEQKTKPKRIGKTVAVLIAGSMIVGGSTITQLRIFTAPVERAVCCVLHAYFTPFLEYIKKSVIPSLFSCYFINNSILTSYTFAPKTSLNDGNIVIFAGGAS